MQANTGRWQLGLALALVTALFWGLLPIALKLALAGMDAWTITWFRFATAALALGAFLAWRGRLPAPSALRGRGAWLFALALLGLVANYVGYLVALDLTSPAVAQVLIQLGPLFLLFGGMAVFGERFAPLQWAGFAVLATGLAVFFHDRLAELLDPGTRLGIGVVLTLFAAAAWAVYALAQKCLLERLDSAQALFLVYLGAVPLLIAPAHPAQLLGLDGLQLAMLAFCCANTVVAYGCFAEALEHWDVSRVSAVLTLAPIFTLAGIRGAAWLWPAAAPAEPLSAWQVLGALLVVAGSMTTALGARSAPAAAAT